MLGSFSIDAQNIVKSSPVANVTNTFVGGGIVIGTAPLSTNTANSVYNFKGYFGEIRIYDHALTADEVSTLYKLGIQKHI